MGPVGDSRAHDQRGHMSAMERGWRSIVDRLDRLDDRYLSRQPDLHEGEEVRWECPVSRIVGSAPRGGRLLLTNSRVLFVAGRLEERLGGRDWTCRSSDVLAVHRSDVSDRARERLRYKLIYGGVGGHFRMVTKNGEDAVFTTLRVDTAVAQLQALLFGGGNA